MFLIEDCCDAFGATVDGKHVDFGDISTVSFYPAHHITMGEGGGVMMNKRSLAKICESYRDWGETVIVNLVRITRVAIVLDGN